MDLLFEMTVRGSDRQEAGKLDRVLIDLADREVTHVVVRSPLASEEVILPISLVQGTHGGQLLLHCLTGELQRMPRYYEGRTSVPPAGRVDTGPSEALWGGIVSGGELGRPRVTPRGALDVSEHARELGPETAVSLRDNVHGMLIGLGTEQNLHRVSQLHVSIPGHGELLAPDSRIVGMESDQIEVNASVAELEQHVKTPVAQYIEVEPTPSEADRP